MNFTAFIEALSAATIDTLADFDREQALAAGLPHATVRSWAKLHGVYFGSSDHRKFQRRALSRARSGGFSLDQLALLERRISHLNPAEQWRYRNQLLANPATYTELEKAIKASVPKRKPKKQEDSKKQEGPKKDPKKQVPAPTKTRTAEENALDIAFVTDVLTHPKFASEGKEQAVILLTLEQHVQATAGEEDVLIQRSDGTSMTGAEYLSRQHAIDLHVALIHPLLGTLNVYRAEQGSANREKRQGKPGPAQRALPLAS